MKAGWQPSSLGAIYLGNGDCLFRVWAPLVQEVEVHLLNVPERLGILQPRDRGYHEAILKDVAPGTRYFFRLDGEKERPDPASRFQPDGVHGPSLA